MRELLAAIIFVALTPFYNYAMMNEVILDTTGTDNFTDESFYGVAVSPGTVSVDTVVVDISYAGNAFFDLDGVSNFAGAEAPVLSEYQGIDPRNIRFGFAGNQPTELSIRFLHGDFNAGDYIRFAVDTDYLGTNDDASETGGEVFGELEIPFRVHFSDDSVARGRFDIGEVPNSSLGVAFVPEPSAAGCVAAWLLLAGMLRQNRKPS